MCSDRKPKCHGRCEKYIEFQKSRRKKNEIYIPPYDYREHQKFMSEAMRRMRKTLVDKK